MNQVLSLYEIMDLLLFHWKLWCLSQMQIAESHSFHFNNICHCVLCKLTLNPQMPSSGVCLFNISFPIVWKAICFYALLVCLTWSIPVRS